LGLRHQLTRSWVQNYHLSVGVFWETFALNLVRYLVKAGLLQSVVLVSLYGAAYLVWNDLSDVAQDV
jgi:hypothetical protein